MKQQRVSWATVLLCAVALLIPAMLFAGPADDPGIDYWNSVSPTEIHRQLWRSKAQVEIDRAFFERQATEKANILQSQYDVQFYDVDIRVNDTINQIFGSVRTVVEMAQNGVTVLVIDLYFNMAVDSIVLAGVGPASYSRSNNEIVLFLDRTYDLGEQVDYTFYYHGSPIGGGFQGFAWSTFNGKKIISTLSEPYQARTWWPCKDRMDDKADSFYIAIEAADEFYVASNGTLDSITNPTATTRKFFYSHRYPMASYLFSLAISEFVVWDSVWAYNSGLDTMPLVHAVFPVQEALSRSTYGRTGEMLDVLSENYGLYPFATEKYGHANFTWGGAMEHQTMSSMNGSGFGFNLDVIVHEMSHQWWGDMITCESWRDIWLNEGWASYSEALWHLAQGGWSDYHDYMNDMAYFTGASQYQVDSMVYVLDTSSVGNIFSSIVYDKGAWVVHMLRGLLGDSLFFVGIDSYRNSIHQFGSATTEDFITVWETATGSTWVRPFIEDWVYGSFNPTYRYSWFTEPSDTGGFDCYVRLRQIQTTDPQVFRMPVDIYVTYTDATGDTIVLYNDQRDQLFSLSLAKEVQFLQFDPSEWILKYANPESWKFVIVTDSLLAPAAQYESYHDTIRAVGITSPAFAVVGGQVPPGISLSSAGVLFGSPAAAGNFSFVIRAVDLATQVKVDKTFGMAVTTAAYTPGDVDGSGTIDIADMVYLVEFSFNEGPEPPLWNAADVNGDCSVDIADVVYLVEYSFSDGPAPVPGCVD